MLEWTLFRGVAIAILILANGFFVAAEFALVSIRDTRVEQLLAHGTPGARSLSRLRAELDDFLPTVQFGVTLASLALGWIGEPTIAPLLIRAFGVLPYGHVFAHVLSAAIFLRRYHVSSCITWRTSSKVSRVKTFRAAGTRGRRPHGRAHPAYPSRWCGS